MLHSLPDLSPAEVKTFRQQLGLTQVGLSNFLELSRPTIEKWEKYGAPGHWRYFFAAVDTGIKPWSAKSSLERLMDRVLDSEETQAKNFKAVFFLMKLDFINLREQWRLPTKGLLEDTPFQYRGVDVYLDEGESRLDVLKSDNRFSYSLGSL